MLLLSAKILKKNKTLFEPFRLKTESDFVHEEINSYSFINKIDKITVLQLILLTSSK